MKQLFCLLILMSVVLGLKAQDTTKPSKQVTIDFINRMVKLAEGTSCTPSGVFTWTEVGFTGNEYFFITNYKGTYNKTSKRTYSEIKWETFSRIWEDSSYDCGLKNISVFFSSKVKAVYNNQSPEYSNFLVLKVPPDKEEKVKKAIMRLVEIAKEENKDPF